MAFRKKYDYIHLYDPDIMTIQECESPERLNSNLNDEYEALWVGDNVNKGLCVFVKRDIKVELLPVELEAVKYILPLRVNNKFNIIAFWAMNDCQNPMQRYISQVWVGLLKCKEYLVDSTIIAGDFNWNLKFDKQNNGLPTLYGNMSDVIKILDNNNILSVYHFFNHVDFGDEKDPTFFMHRRQLMGYHTDYIWMSRCLINSIRSFCIGNFSDWCKLSDHMPIFVEWY